MRNWTRASAMALLGLMLVTTGCATRAQLRQGLEAQSAALEAHQRALEEERAARVAEDQRLASELGALTADLAMLRDEHGVRIAYLEEGMEFAVPVHFAFDAAEVRAEARPALERFAGLVRRHYPESMITVEGFADPAGPAAYNRQLSQRRADAVRASLVDLGVPAGQLRAVGYGADRLVVPGAAGRAPGAELNRRVVFVVETPRLAGVPAGSPTSSR
jgi:outer membrane protein OmpA-like peptidoglycan-associated protein